MRFAALLGMAILLMAAAPPPHRHQSAPRGLQFVDLTGDFDRIWNATSNLPDDKRPEAFEAAFAKVLPGFYDPKRVDDFMRPDQYRDFVLKGLKNYPAHKAAIEGVSHKFTTMIGPAQRSFEKAFGPMRGYPPIYLVNSFGEFDGGTRDLPEGERLLFGADVISMLYEGKPVQPFFHHELFHLLNHRYFKECEQLWCSLWSEGLAVYVAATLNPGASDDALLLNFPAPIRPAVEAHRTEAICAVASRLNSTSKSDYAPLFMAGVKPLSPDLPPRFGYYVGYLVARDLGRTRSLKQLAVMPNAQVKSLLDASLARMAACPSKAA